MLRRVASGIGGLVVLALLYRAWSDPGWLAPILGLEPIHFIMERRMLRGIRERVERMGADTARGWS